MYQVYSSLRLVKFDSFHKICAERFVAFSWILLWKNFLNIELKWIWGRFVCPPKNWVRMLVKSSTTPSTNIVLCSHFHATWCSDTKACPTDLHFATPSHPCRYQKWKSWGRFTTKSVHYWKSIIYIYTMYIYIHRIYIEKMDSQFHVSRNSRLGLPTTCCSKPVCHWF